MSIFSGMTPRGNYTADQLALVERQISLWVNNRDDVGAAADWLPDGILTAPRGVRLTAPEIAGVIDQWHQLFQDLHVDIAALFASDDGAWMAIEWSWHVTRTSDGVRSITPDSIIVELRDNKIVQWREYFDTFGSVEFETTP